VESGWGQALDEEILILISSTFKTSSTFLKYMFLFMVMNMVGCG
jgi:hypothetical protein